MARRARKEAQAEPAEGAPAGQETAAAPRRRRRSRRAVVALPAQAEGAPVEQVREPSAEEPPRRRMSVAVPDDAPPIPGIDDAARAKSRTGNTVADPSRARRRRQKPAAEPVVEPEKPAKGRSTRRRGKPAEPKPLPIAVVELPTPKERKPKRWVEKPRWPKPILPPYGAPRVGTVNGQPVLVVNEKVVVPHFFFGNIHSEASERAVLSEVRKAGEQGVHLYSLYLEVPVDPKPEEPPSEEAERLLEQLMQADPDGYVVFRSVFTPAKGWTAKYPGAIYRYPDGSLAEPSICAEDFWGEAEKCLKRLVTEVAKRKNGSRVLGYHLERGEWFNPSDAGYDTSPAGEEAFRKWLRSRYLDDVVALRASWFDGNADFATLKIPSHAELENSPGALLTDRRERRWADYHDFLSDMHAERIGRLARVVKEASKGASLVGCSYGYTFEFRHPHSGHLSLGRLLKCPDIDIIAGPPNYTSRLPGGACPFPGPIDSVALAGKLFILEEDYKTGLGRKDEPDTFNPTLETPQALEAAHLRGLGMALTHAAGVSWMDTWGSGWLDTRTIWSRAELARTLWTKLLANRAPDPEVAVIIDERSITMLQDPRLYDRLIAGAREAVLKSGVSAGFYLLSDLANREFPDCKLHLFLNAWDIGPAVRAAIKEKLHRRGKTLAWWYGAALTEYHRPALDRVREVTGIALKAQPFNSRPGTTITHRKHPLTENLDDNALADEEVFEPTYCVVEEEAKQLGEYTDTGLVSFAVREVRSPATNELTWRSVFLGEPNISPQIIRGLCRVAGVAIWDQTDDVVHVRPPFLSVHSARPGKRALGLPPGWEARDVVEGRTIDRNELEIAEPCTKLLLVGPREELTALDSAVLPDAPAIALPPAPEPEPEPDVELEPALQPIAVAAEKPVRERTPRQRRRTTKPAPQSPAPAPPPHVDEDMEVTFRFRKKS